MANSDNFSLWNDPFLLHTALEENIGPNIGNDIFQSWDSFKKHVPVQYQRLINSSDHYVKRLRDFYFELKRLDINIEEYIDYYDDTRYEANYVLNKVIDKETLSKGSSVAGSFDSNITKMGSELFIQNKGEKIR